MRSERPKLALTIGLIGSLAFHGVVVLPLFVSLLAGAGPTEPAPDSLGEEPLHPPESPPPPEVQLGLESSTASTLTWVGYDEYVEHLAERADFEQAEFTMTDAAKPGLPAPGPVVQPTPPSSTPPPEDQTDSPPSAQPAGSPATLLTMIETLMEMARSSTQTPEIAPSPTDSAPNEAETPPAEESPTPKPPNPKPDPKPTEPAEPVKPDPPTDPSPPLPAAPGTDAPVTEPTTDPPGTPQSDPGDPSDRESNATSKISLDEIKRGKPLARGGLELRPKKPQFTTLTLLTAAPRNPTVRITFGKNGIPTTAAIISDSGDQRVDHAIESSLYRWRASGPQLTALKEGETIDIELRIILNSRMP